MCPGRIYPRRHFEMNPEENATIYFRAGGPWQLLDAKGEVVTDGEMGGFTLLFKATSSTSLEMVTIDPDPGGGTVG